MAVVQISRVQIRRGRKNSLASGVPQLASGEMGWAVDTQELFIGNGSVAEGAPYVGNTKILTEHDNILDLALQYQYKRNNPSIQTGSTPSLPIERTVQERLDDTVSIRSFGAAGDGVTDDTLAIQRALDQLYLNPATVGLEKSRVVLLFEPGVYRISTHLRIPPFAVLKGSGKDKTIISQTGNFPVAYTVGDDSIPGSYTGISTMSNLNQPRFIEIEGITFRHTKRGYSVLDLVATRNSKFSGVKFEGIWGTPAEAGNRSLTADYGVQLTAKSTLVTSELNSFEDCDFVNLSYGIFSEFNISHNVFNNCLISVCGIGVKFGNPLDNSTGRDIGPRFNKVSSTRFLDIDRQGFFINEGTGNVSQGNTFLRVGNNNGTSAAAVYAVIESTDNGNISDNDYFERSIDLTSNAAFISSEPYIGEFGGKVNGNHKFNKSISPITSTVSSVPLFRLSGFNTSRYRVHYLYRSTSSNLVRQGIMDIMVDRINHDVHLTDEYDFVGDPTKSENLKFTAGLEDVDANSTKDTVNIYYTNSTAGDTSITASFNYWYEVLS